MLKAILRAISALTGHDEDVKSSDGSIHIADGISGVEDTRRTGALDPTPANAIRISFPAGPKYVRLKPIGGAGNVAKVAVNAPDVTSATSTATAIAWLNQADSKDSNMMYRRITVDAPIEEREFFDPDGIFCLDLIGPATITAVEATAVGG